MLYSITTVSIDNQTIVKHIITQDMKTLIIYSTALFLLLILDSRASAQDGDTTALSQSDIEFISKVTSNNYAEIEMANLAIESSQNDPTVSYAKNILDEHNIIAEELNGWLQERNYSMDNPTQENIKSSVRDLLFNKTRPFEENFSTSMVKTHEEMVQLFADASEGRGVDHPELVAFANKHLPALRERLQQGIKLKNERSPIRQVPPMAPLP